MKEIKDHINRWGETPCSWAGRINTVKMTTLLNAAYRLSAPHRITSGSFHRTKQKIHNSYGTKHCKESKQF